MNKNTKVVRNGSYNGHITAPPSKSCLQRSVVVASLCKGDSVISGYAPNRDTDAVICAVRSLGAKVRTEDDKIFIKGIKVFNRPVSVHCGESGLAARMFSALSLLFSKDFVITGEGSLFGRSLEMAEKTLLDAGKTVRSESGCIPMRISGNCEKTKFFTDAYFTSQFLSGLLISLPKSIRDTTVFSKETQSKPYIDLTLDILHKCGIEIENCDYSVFSIRGGQYPDSFTYRAEGCWSSASFHLVAAAVSGFVSVDNLSTVSKQGDRALKDLLVRCGASVSSTKNNISVLKGQLRPFCFDATNCPDLFPPLAALAANCRGISVITGVDRLVGKESNRARSIQTEFSKLGIEVLLKGNVMVIKGGNIRGGLVSSHNDHRIAMALAIMGLTSTEPVIIIQPESVAKSYPAFFDEHEKLKSNTEIILS